MRCVWCDLIRCATGTPPENDHLRLNPHSIIFLHGPGKDQPSGQLKNIALSNTTLSGSTIRSSCRCELNTFAKPCTTTVFKSPSAALTVYSSVRNRDAPGVGFGRGRLNSPQVVAGCLELLHCCLLWFLRKASRLFHCIPNLDQAENLITPPL